jgi:hypothetical protein
MLAKAREKAAPTPPTKPVTLARAPPKAKQRRELTALQRLKGVAYQRPGVCERGEARPEVE